MEDLVPPKPISSSDVPWTEWSDIPNFAMRYRHLTVAAMGEDYHVGVAIEELAPGKRTVPAHYHIFEEEHLYVLEGSLTTRIGDSSYEMKAGDYVCYPAGQRAGHCLINNSREVCRYVIVGERNPNEVVVYTDSSKVLVRALGRRAIFDMNAIRGYWDGENTGLPEGHVAPADGKGLAPVAPFVAKAPISSGDVAWEASHESERFGGRAKHLTYAAVGRNYRVGMLIESPAPGKRLAPRHYHMLEEEHALILEGQVTLLLGDEQFEMKAGDYVCFPAGIKVPHAFMNSGSGPCSYLMIGEQNPNEVCVYPDSNKIMVRALQSYDDIFDMSATRNYWDGE
ncbi:cupin domain-containing protein [Rhizobium sp. LjRoot254]|uniref:cupin domain-containing protein n=1 Tax=Rhizobium sp. LjRoot254 TaxID=3342297 RepID=UPI003ECC6973